MVNMVKLREKGTLMQFNNIHLTNPYLQLPDICFDRVEPTPLKDPYLIHWNPHALHLLEIDPQSITQEEMISWLNGTLKLQGSDPFAMCYAGHQFGHFVPQLGDGRAINIGTINQWHLQLKGAGITRYSRQGDGRAVLRSSIREYLMSEAMHALGIESTRALAIIGSKQRVYRERWESTAIVLRLSPSWIRFGTFEYFAHNNHPKALRALLDYAITESYPHLIDEPNRDLLFFTEVVGKTARLMAQWQAIGFNHGVMNTDNMSIAGLTIDYGPFAFLDNYDIHYICNHTDQRGRYSFGNQPRIGEWNLTALMVALSPLISKSSMERVLGHYGRLYSREFLYQMGKKLGLAQPQEQDIELIKSLLETMQELEIEYTLFFRTLSHYQEDRTELLRLARYHKPLHQWLDAYDQRLKQEPHTPQERHTQMLQTNPKYVLKNYMIDEAIRAAQEDDFSVVDALFKIAKTPYDEHKEFERWAGATPQKFKNQKLSCSS